MVTAEGTFPKSGGDPPYASEFNNVFDKVNYHRAVATQAISSGTAWQELTNNAGSIVAFTSPNQVNMLKMSYNGAVTLSANEGGNNCPLTFMVDGGSIINNFYNFISATSAGAPRGMSGHWAGSIAAGSHTYAVAIKSASNATITFNSAQGNLIEGNFVVELKAGELG